MLLSPRSAVRAVLLASLSHVVPPSCSSTAKRQRCWGRKREHGVAGGWPRASAGTNPRPVTPQANEGLPFAEDATGGKRRDVGRRLYFVAGVRRRSALRSGSCRPCEACRAQAAVESEAELKTYEKAEPPDPKPPLSSHHPTTLMGVGLDVVEAPWDGVALAEPSESPVVRRPRAGPHPTPPPGWSTKRRPFCCDCDSCSCPSFRSLSHPERHSPARFCCCCCCCCCCWL
jgi:hypothetical protein